MIDIESDVIESVAASVEAVYPDMLIIPETVYSPPQFPCVCIEETDSYVYTRTSDSATVENNDVVVFEVNVYSNKVNGKRTQAKEILAVVDEAFIDLGFVRTMTTSVAMDEATKQRLFARYTAVTDKKKNIYRR